MDMIEKLATTLKALDLADLQVKVEKTNGWQVGAEVVSSDFETMSEYNRQGMVWDRAIKTLSAQERPRVEFVLTNAPSELKPKVAAGN